MAIYKGLSIDKIHFIQDEVDDVVQPTWLDFTAQIASLTGNTTLLNLGTSFINLQQFLFRTPKWPIGGVYFDGIMKTDHRSTVRPTNYPVQTGVIMTDHVIREPQELTVEIFMSDVNAAPSMRVNNLFIDNILSSVQFITNSSYIDGKFGEGDGRSAKAYQVLKRMQMDMLPITVETRLQTYENMIITEVSTPDDVKTLHALKSTIRMREIIVANAPEVKASARAQATSKQNQQGEKNAQAEDPNKTTAKAGIDGIKKVLS